MPERRPPTRRLAVADLLARWAAVRRSPAVVERSLAAARGAVLAETVTASGPLPAAAVALLDGWAVVAAESAGASPYAPADLSEARRVAAGDSVPPPFDAVAALDEATRTTIDVALAPGAGLRRIGEDASAGEVLLARGASLDRRALAALAAAGRPSVAVAEGRAVVAADDASGGSLADLLAGLLAVRGIVSEIVPLADVAGAAPAADVVVALGGAAIGADDPAWRAVSAAPGFEGFGRIALRPGETVVAGRIGASPVLVVPARLDEVAAVALALILPSLDAALGGRDDDVVETRPLVRKLASAIGFSELALFAGSQDGAGWEPLGVGSLGLAALARAERWALLPPESEGAGPATPFSTRPWPREF